MYKFVRYTLIIASIWLGLLGKFSDNFNVLLCAVTCFFVHNILYCIEQIELRIYLLMFHIMIFVFLLGRPVIAFARGEIWWLDFGKADVRFALNAIGLSIVFLFCGAVFQQGKKYRYIKKKDLKCSYKSEFENNIRIISELLFYISTIFNGILELEKLRFMHGREYTDYYIFFQSDMPFFVHAMSSLMPYCLCVFLATKPKKLRSFLALGLYFILAIPDLIIGMRNPVMLRGIFCFLYFFMREAEEKKGRWFGKAEKIFACSFIPIVMCFMGIYANIRKGEVVLKENFFKLFTDFFYKQGVSFDVLAIGHACIPQLPEREFRNYTFGGMIDYIIHGNIGQRLWGTLPLDNGNSLYNALESNSFAHNMSYISKGEKYLKGEGWGSSYLLETYTDWGYLGIIVFSFVLGIILIYGVYLWRRGGLPLSMFLVMSTEIFFAPRGEATKSIEFLIRIQFWFCIMVCCIGAGLCCKKYENIKHSAEEKDV